MRAAIAGNRGVARILAAVLRRTDLACLGEAQQAPPRVAVETVCNPSGILPSASFQINRCPMQTVKC